MSTTIYALRDPETGAVRYVGKAVNLPHRLKAHRNDRSESRKSRWLRALGRLGLEPIVLVLEVLVDEEWQEAERRWIAFWRAQGADLTNLTDGGEGLHNPPEVTRQKISLIRQALWRDPETRARLEAVIKSPVRRARIAAALAGRPKAAEHVAKLPQNQPGRRLSEEHRQRISDGLRGNQNARGLEHSPDTKARISAALHGNRHTAGHVMPPEERLKRSVAQRGQPKSEEWKQKIREGQLRAWKRRKTTADADPELP